MQNPNISSFQQIFELFYPHHVKFRFSSVDKHSDHTSCSKIIVRNVKIDFILLLLEKQFPLLSCNLWVVDIIYLMTPLTHYYRVICMSVVERQLIAWWVVETIVHGRLIGLFLVPLADPRLVICDMWYVIFCLWGEHTTYILLVIRNSSPCMAAMGFLYRWLVLYHYDRKEGRKCFI